MSEDYEYENDHADRFHDYEEDAMQDDLVEEGEDDRDYQDDPYYDEFSNDDNPYNEDLGWDGGYED